MDPRQRAHASVPAAPRAKAGTGLPCGYGYTSRLRSTHSFTIAAYDHAVQAGSSVDCFKHIVLICLLQRMVRDGDPFLLIDTHAGRGRTFVRRFWNGLARVTQLRKRDQILSGLYDLTREVPMQRNASKWGVQTLCCKWVELEAAQAVDTTSGRALLI